MSTTGSKKENPSRKKGGGSRSGRPKVGVRAPKRAAEFLERLLPESHEQSGEAFADRQTRRKTAHEMERTFTRAIETFDRIEEELDKEEASVEQREWDDRDERRRSDERAREREEDRKDMRLDLEVEERRQAMTHRNVFLALTVVTTLVALALLYLAVRHEQVGYAGVSLFSTVLSGLFFRLMRWPAGMGVGAANPSPVPRPFPWSVLVLRGEVDGEELGESRS